MSQRQKQNSFQTVCRCCCSCNSIQLSDLRLDEVMRGGESHRCADERAKAGDAHSGPLWRQQVKAGNTASGTESRDVRRYGRGLAGSDDGKPWRRRSGGWLVARGVMRTVTRSSSSKTAVGVSTEGSQRCKRSSACLEHETETRSQPATGARQTEKLSARE